VIPLDFSTIPGVFPCPDGTVSAYCPATVHDDRRRTTAMIRGTSLALALALTGSLLLSGVAQAASPLTASASVAIPALGPASAVSGHFKEAGGLLRTGRPCAQDCSGATTRMSRTVTTEPSSGTTRAPPQGDAIDACRARSERPHDRRPARQCANNARLQSQGASSRRPGGRRQARRLSRASGCLGACASCGLPSQCP
jgi:hypothetical protein